MRAVCFAIMMLMLLQGCGLKGPLYLPTEKQKQDTADRERLLQEREARRRGEVPATPPAAQQPAPAQEYDTDLLPEVAPPPPGEPPSMEPSAPPPP
jgi:predicted small lipoprotein YifL